MSLPFFAARPAPEEKGNTMARFTTLYSGSSGNCAVVEEQGRYLLVDMGKSCRLTQNALKELGLAPHTLDGVLVTHEHSDHVGGLAIFLKYHPVPVYGSAATLEYLAGHGLVPPGARLVDIDGRTEAVGGFGVQSYETSHDSLACRGYRVAVPSGGVVSIATDLGFVSGEVMANLLLADVVALESNYDPTLLRTGPYPYYLKTRIASHRGHLSNDACGDALARLVQNGCEKFLLCHISQENNTPELALAGVRAAFLRAGVVPGRDCVVRAAARHAVSPVFTF